MKKNQAHIIVAGKVQGVNFRNATLQKAEELKITGWVKNRGDGAVEIVAEGETDLINQFIKWCSHGPASARVDSTTVARSQEEQEFYAFNIIYT